MISLWRFVEARAGPGLLIFVALEGLDRAGAGGV